MPGQLTGPPSKLLFSLDCGNFAKVSKSDLCNEASHGMEV